MKTKKIIIKVPQKEKDKWSIGRNKRVSPVLIYRLLERKVLRHLGVVSERKMAIRVEYGGRYHNETLPSSDAVYLLYTSICFLEDYLGEIFLKNRTKKYQQN